MILVDSVCMYVCIYVCICQTVTLESLDVGSSYLHIRYSSSRQYGSSLYIWRSSDRDQGLSSPKGRKFLFPQCKTSIAHNSGSVKDRAIRFACRPSMGLRRIEWCDRHLCHVIRSDQAQLNDAFAGDPALD